MLGRLKCERLTLVDLDERQVIHHVRSVRLSAGHEDQITAMQSARDGPQVAGADGVPGDWRDPSLGVDHSSARSTLYERCAGASRTVRSMTARLPATSAVTSRSRPRSTALTSRDSFSKVEDVPTLRMAVDPSIACLRVAHPV